MKKNYLSLLLILVAMAGIAQTADNRFAVPFGFNMNHVDARGNREIFKLGESSIGAETGLKYFLSPSFNLAGNISQFKIDSRVFSYNATDLDLALEFKLANGTILPEESKFKPYIMAGMGAYLDKEDFAVIPFGAGIRSAIDDDLDWFVQSRYKLSPNEKDFNYLTTSIGLIGRIGGKKDADGDGIADKDDACPNAAGPMSTNGCPDADGDGVADRMDNCPQVAGPASLQGCPDSDGDGIIDLQDACPYDAGLESLKGCPDTDGDGVADKDDQCPEVPGTIEGCPDADGDGIVDGEDNCPEEAGLSENGGCPEKDTDNDGIIDREDSCPTLKGVASNNGCPEIEEEVTAILREALEGVQFRSGSDVLLGSSYSKLDKVIEVMNSHPDFKLEISGYTDNTGNADANLALSQKRAHAAEKYIVDGGIAASRITAEGYGIANPIADNNTSEGRARNRRVEFKIVF